MTIKLWIWSRSTRRRSSVMFGCTPRMIKFRVAPIPILFATWPGRMNWRSFQENSTCSLSEPQHFAEENADYPLSMDINVISLGIVQKLLRSGPFNERYAGAPLVCAQEDVQDSTTTDYIDDIFVRHTIRHIFGHNGSLLRLGVMLSLRLRSRGRLIFPFEVRRK